MLLMLNYVGKYSMLRPEIDNLIRLYAPEYIPSHTSSSIFGVE